MRKVKFNYLIALLVLFSFFSNKRLIAQEIRFKESKQNFGFVHEGEVVTIAYELTNMGKEPLIINDYKVECGCTVMEKPLKPIMPNETLSLIVKFDTTNKYDRQDRTVTVISNAINSPSVIRFKGVVLKPKKKN